MFWLAAVIMLWAFAVRADEVQPLRYEQLLPDQVRAEILAELGKIPFDEPGLANTPGLEALSGESSDKYHRSPMVGRIRLFEGPRFDVWVSRNYRLEGKRKRDLGKEQFFTIAVDKKSVPKKAYFLTFMPEPVEEGRLPRPATYALRCLDCHASGPKAFRPLRNAPKNTKEKSHEASHTAGRLPDGPTDPRSGDLDPVHTRSVRQCGRYGA